jgi:hypothetical protein
VFAVLKIQAFRAGIYLVYGLSLKYSLKFFVCFLCYVPYTSIMVYGVCITCPYITSFMLKLISVLYVVS